MSETAFPPVIPAEGWHVLHLFYKIEYGQWSLLTPDERREAKTRLSALVQEIRATEKTQLLTFSMVSPKADLGFMLLTPDLQTANEMEKRLTLSLGADLLSPVFSFLSLTELSEYFSSDEEYSDSLQREQNMKPGSTEYEEAMTSFRDRLKKYQKNRMYPTLPDWPVFCFYPMNKRRQQGQNWFAMDFEKRKALMSGHARVGRKYTDKVRQLITGSTGLDDDEWGVTLFAHDTFQIKAIVYEMRFDEVSAIYADFGEFFIGLQLPLNELFRRLQLHQ